MVWKDQIMAVGLRQVDIHADEHLEIHACVLQATSPLGPLPKKVRGRRGGGGNDGRGE